MAENMLFQRNPASTGESSIKNCRLNEHEITQLAAEFNEWMGAGPSGQLKSEKMIETLLNYLAGGGYYRQLGHSSGIATSTAFRHTRLTTNFIYEKASDYISLPRAEHEFEQLSSRIEMPDGQMKQVILYIDGYISRIQRPDHAGDAYFCGRHGKSCDSINTQLITDKFEQVRHIITGLSGATHDKTATEWSMTFMQFLDDLPGDYVVLVDPAYRNLHPSVIHRVVKPNLSAEEERYNLDVTKLRQIVERAIGATQLRWRLSQLKESRMAAKGGILFPSKCLVAMSYLHNRYTNYLV
ncbi:uncharacterized protein LOC121412400 [Lytechinus variegatus]|uniref:uncharacterized protein LOC121412400 n=1 Tax=Lytechinus variegatus TaxID=7654 RepID=UPI001BB12970|nr:uncharacterized protein LOC121412400 [Lytechinus variegatus]